MQLTDEQLEQAARELCKMRGFDLETEPREILEAKSHIRNWTQIQEAVNRVVK